MAYKRKPFGADVTFGHATEDKCKHHDQADAKNINDNVATVGQRKEQTPRQRLASDMLVQAIQV